jgi:PTH1 family peptidyl-tRNA hydrolase
MKYLIVGLGNPGAEYENTRHNIGFKILDGFLNKDDSFESCKHGSRLDFSFKSRKIILLKPNTFMNLSGKAVRYWMIKEKVNLDNLLIVTDDIALPFGAVRLRPKGSDGGHNGLKGINEVLLNNNYPRLRIGVGRDFERGRQVDYVFGNWSEDQRKDLNSLIYDSVKVIKSFCSIGIEYTMNNLNRNKL